MWVQPSEESLRAARLVALEGALLALLGDALGDDPRAVSLRVEVRNRGAELGVSLVGEVIGSDGVALGGFEL